MRSCGDNCGDNTSRMTHLHHNRETIYDLERDDEVCVGTTAYTVKGFARGGMGFILFLERTADWHSHQLSVHGPKLAIKTVLGGDDDLRSMFKRELTVWAGLHHPHILNLNEIIEADQTWVAAMDWCEGSLRSYLVSNGRIPQITASKIITDLVGALDYAYAKDSVHHLDVKPENVIFTRCFSPEGRFMLSDWGIASVKNEALRRTVEMVFYNDQDHTFNNIGTISYMAPERFKSGHQSSVASDIFSIGMMYFELLAGMLPFDLEAPVINQLNSHAYFDRIEHFSAELGFPNSIREVILGCVRPNPIHRISSYGELLKQLARANRASLPFLSRIFRN